MSDDSTTAEAIVADATRALDAIDRQVGQLRAHRFETSEKIAKLLKERKPLARIVTAAHGRRSKTTSQPE